MPFDPGFLASGQNGMTGQLGAVVADHHARQPAPFGDGGYLATTRRPDSDGTQDKTPRL
jgi:hypothetical protein